MSKIIMYVVLLLLVPVQLVPAVEKKGKDKSMDSMPSIPLNEPPVKSSSVPLYEPYVIAGKFVFISGQLPRKNGKLVMGKVGDTVSQEQAKKAAASCAQEILTRLKQAVGFQKVKRCVKLTGYVNATADFIHHSQVIDGASEVIIDQLKERGKHARVAVGVSSLPHNAAVEVEAIFELW